MDQSPLEYSNKHHIELLGRCVQQITNLMCCHLFFVSQDPPSAWHETDLKMEYEHWEPLATALQTSPKLSVVDFASSIRNQEPGHPRDLAVYGLDELLANPNRKVVTLSYIVPASRSSSAKPALRFLGYDHITGLRSSIMCAAVGMPLLHAEPSHLYSGLSYNTLPAHLRELTLGMTFTTAYQLYKLLSSAAKTLKHLTLSCMSIEEETAEETRSISLLDLPRLNYLHMFLTSSLSSTVQDNDEDFGLRMVLNFVRRFASPALMELGISHQPSKVNFDALLAMIKEPGFENLKIALFSFVDPLEEDISPPTFCQDGSELMRYAEQRKILMCRSEEEWCSACLDSPDGHDCC